MCNGDHVFTIALDIVHLDILACALVEEVFEVDILVRNRTSLRPHGISKTYGRTLGRGTVASIRLEMETMDVTATTYRFIAARYRYLCIMGTDGCIFSKYI